MMVCIQQLIQYFETINCNRFKEGNIKKSNSVNWWLLVDTSTVIVLPPELFLTFVATSSQIQRPQHGKERKSEENKFFFANIVRILKYKVFNGVRKHSKITYLTNVNFQLDGFFYLSCSYSFNFTLLEENIFFSSFYSRSKNCLSQYLLNKFDPSILVEDKNRQEM